MNKKKKNALIAASVAGFLAMTGAALMPAAHAAEGAACYGINKCKGTGDCGGKGHSCAGQNSCKGQGWIDVKDAETCLSIQGGTLEPNS